MPIQKKVILYGVFLDLEKAHDSYPMGTPNNIVQLIKFPLLNRKYQKGSKSKLSKRYRLTMEY